jgi:hypothetical protein
MGWACDASIELGLMGIASLNAILQRRSLLAGRQNHGLHFSIGKKNLELRWGRGKFEV